MSQRDFSISDILALMKKWLSKQIFDANGDPVIIGDTTEESLALFYAKNNEDVLRWIVREEIPATLRIETEEDGTWRHLWGFIDEEDANDFTRRFPEQIASKTIH